MVGFVVAKRRHRRRLSAGRSDLDECLPGARCEDDQAVAIPCAAQCQRRLGEDLYGSGRRTDRLQLAAREERDDATVGGPERETGAFGTVEDLRLELVDRANR